MKKTKRTALIILLLCASGHGLLSSAQVAYAEGDPISGGIESEPAMEYFGDFLVSVQSELGRRMRDLVIRENMMMGLTASWEWPVALGLMIIQHEVAGHGGRAREFFLRPRYGVTPDLVFYTSLRRDPETNIQTIVLAAAGVEANTVVAHRLLTRLYAHEGIHASTLPLLLVSKMDYALYTLSTPSIRSQRFQEAYEEGHDFAIWLTARQGQRVGASASEVWQRDYVIVADDPLLSKNHKRLKRSAVWSLLDPSVLAAAYSYFYDYLWQGKTRVRPPLIQLSSRYGMTLGTRAAAGPDNVTEFLDLYLIGDGPVWHAYGRRLHSCIDQTWGWGLAIYHVPFFDRHRIGLRADVWNEPDSLERIFMGKQFHLASEVACWLTNNVGFTVKLGYKSQGFFPGFGLDGGFYGGGGIQAVF